MTTRLKQKTLFWLAISTMLGALLTAAAHGGCYCMMESKMVSAAYNKTGFSESLVSTPPKLFLQSQTIQVRIVSHSYDDGSGGIQTINWSYRSIELDNYDLSTITNIAVYHPVDCRYYTLPYTSSYTSIDHGVSYSSSPSFSNIEEWSETYHQDNNTSPVSGGGWYQSDSYGDYSSGTMDSFPYGHLIDDAIRENAWTTTYQSTSTMYKMDSEYVYSDPSGYGWSYNDSDIVTTISSSEFTDDMLRKQIIARLPDWPTNWSVGSGLAAYTLDDNHYCGSASKMQFRVKVPSSEKGTTYLLGWQEATQTPGSTNITYVPKHDLVIGTGDPVNPAVGKTFLVDVPAAPSSISETAPDIILTFNTGSGNGPSPGQGGQLPVTRGGQ